MTTSSAAPGWRIDESSTAGRENLDADHVRRYDAKEDSKAQAEVEVLAALGLGAESVVIEFGPGTGQFTLEAARRFSSVVAVDVSPAMVDQLRRKLALLEIENVAVVEAGFVSYDHQGPAVEYTSAIGHPLQIVQRLSPARSGLD